MKLNKVLALALSGVMAVSMLAGCSGNSGNGGQNGEGEPPVVDNSLTGQVISALSKDTTDKVTFTSDNALGVTLQKAIENAGARYSELSVANEADVEKLVMEADTSLKTDVLPYINDDSTKYTDRENTDKKEQNTFSVIVYDAKGQSAEYAVKQLAAEIEKEQVMGEFGEGFTTKELPTYTSDYTDSEGKYYYDFDYTGKMSVVTVSDAVTGQTVYVAAYTITRTPTKVEK